MAMLEGLDIPHKGEIQYGFPPPEGEDVLWRCEAKSYSYVIDADSDRYGSTAPVLEMHWYRVLKWTKTGARLETGQHVFLDDKITRRRWACRTPAEALESFRERRKRQIKLLTGQLKWAQYELELAEGATA